MHNILPKLSNKKNGIRENIYHILNHINTLPNATNFISHKNISINCYHLIDFIYYLTFENVSYPINGI